MFPKNRLLFSFSRDLSRTKCREVTLTALTSFPGLSFPGLSFSGSFWSFSFHLSVLFFLCPGSYYSFAVFHILLIEFDGQFVRVLVFWVLGLTVQARTKRTTQTRILCKGRVSSDEGMSRRWWVSASARTCQEGKDFSFVIHCDSLALWCIVVKNKTNSRVWRSLIL